MRFSKNGRSLWQRIGRRIQRMRQGRLKSFSSYTPYVAGKRGLEIGGPSAIFREAILPLYDQIGQLDNCDFARETAWANHKDSFVFHPDKVPGSTLFCDGSELAIVPDQTYDVLFSSHNLEHFANPVKALREWRRVLKDTGALVLVLPDYRQTFDHHRTPTPVDHMFEDYENRVGEDDMTHLAEILEKHDLRLDPAAGTKEEFHRRSLNNFENRCFHHHVFDENNSRELLVRAGFEVAAVELAYPFHICLLARVA